LGLPTQAAASSMLLVAKRRRLQQRRCVVANIGRPLDLPDLRVLRGEPSRMGGGLGFPNALR